MHFYKTNFFAEVDALIMATTSAKMAKDGVLYLGMPLVKALPCGSSAVKLYFRVFLLRYDTWNVLCVRPCVLVSCIPYGPACYLVSLARPGMQYTAPSYSPWWTGCWDSDCQNVSESCWVYHEGDYWPPSISAQNVAWRNIC